MKPINFIWVVFALVILHVKSASSYDYPSCLMEPVAGAPGPVILILDQLDGPVVQSCMERHLQAQLPRLDLSRVSFDAVPERLVQRRIGNREANFALVGMESSGNGESNLLGVAVALSGDAKEEEVTGLRIGDDWAEVARLSAFVNRDQSIVGRLRGHTQYWSMLGQLEPRALANHEKALALGKSGQHFHLIQIHCGP